MSFDAGEIIARLKLDREEFNLGLDEALADADAKTKDGIHVKVKPELDETAMDEVLVEEEPLREDIKPEVKPSYKQAEAEAVGRTLARDILTGAEDTKGGGGIGGLIAAMLGQGLTQQELTSGLKNLGFSKAEIDSALGSMFLDTAGGASVAESIAAGIVPTGEQLGTAIESNLTRDSVTVKRDIGAAISQWFSGGFGNANGNFFEKLINGPNGPFAALTAGSGGAISAIFNPLGLAAGTAFLGAFGEALGGMTAGTAIGGAGVFAALIPGYLDLMKGIAASSALSSGGSLKGMSPGQIALGRQLQGLIGAGSKGLGAAENLIMPDIGKFIKALTGAIPLMDKFAKPAINAMKGFFDAIDKGMGSGNFKQFVTDMSKLVGSTMHEFGQTILNLGGALGGFLKLFGPVGSDTIGPWFVRVSGEFDKFMNHIKLGPGFTAGMKTVFGSIGEILKTFSDGLKGAGQILAPIGLAFFRLAGFLATVVDKVPFAAPLMVTLGTALVSMAIGLKAIGIAQAVFGPVVALIRSHMATAVTAVVEGDATMEGANATLAASFNPILAQIALVAGAMYLLKKQILDPLGNAITPNGNGSIDQGLINGTVGTKNQTNKPPHKGWVSVSVGGPSGPFVWMSPADAKKYEAGFTSASGGKKTTNHVTITVNAPGHKSAHDVAAAVKGAIGASLPSLQAALARGAA